jgi:hypothetical protein
MFQRLNFRNGNLVHVNLCRKHFVSELIYVSLNLREKVSCFWFKINISWKTSQNWQENIDKTCQSLTNYSESILCVPHKQKSWSKGPFKYYVMIGLGGWVGSENGHFYLLSVHWGAGWMGQKKSKKNAYVIFEWSPRRTSFWHAHTKYSFSVLFFLFFSLMKMKLE